MESHVICRTCLRQTDKSISIFATPKLWGKNILIAKLIMACAPVVIKIGDGLPSNICKNCVELLQLSFLFRLRVITANENYKEIIQAHAQVLQDVQPVNNTQTTNLNHIYSTDYIVESIKNETTRNHENVKQERLDIKEEPINIEKDISSSSTTIREEAQNEIQCNTLPENPQNSVKNTKTPKIPQNQTQCNTLPENPQKHSITTKEDVLPEKHSTPKIEQTSKRKKITCSTEFQKHNQNIPSNPKRRTTNNSNKNNISNGTLNTGELNKEPDNLSIINKHLIKRTYSNIDNGSSQLCKLRKLQKQATVWKNISVLKEIEDIKPLITTNPETINSECIVIDSIIIDEN